MNKDEFKEAMTHPKNVYCLVSSDAEMIDLYISRFKDAIKADQVIYGSIQVTGKLFKKRTLCVLYEPKLSEDLFERKEFIFIHTDSIDKRMSVYKKYKNQIIELNNDYTNWVMNNSDMNESDARQFVKRCKNDLGIIRSELTLYKESGQYYNDYSSDIYLWVDNFLKNLPLPRVEDSEINQMALLANNCQDLLKVKQHKTEGMNSYRVMCMNELKSYRTEEELKNIIKDCFYYDCQIKRGLIEPKYTILIIKEKYHAITN